MTQEQDWQEIKGRIAARWPGLPEGELDQTRGERMAILGLLRRSGIAEGDDARLQHDLDLALLGEHAQESRGVGGIPMVAGQPPDVANAVTGEEYAAGEQGAARIGDEGTPMADASTPPLPSMVEQPRPRSEEGTPASFDDRPGAPPSRMAG